MIDDSVYFLHEDSPLSNFYSCEFTYESEKFTCSEQAFQYHKATFFKDEETADKIMATDIPSEQKGLSYEIKGFIRAKWDCVQDEMMKAIITAKFNQCDSAREHLLSTMSRTLVEANSRSLYWGVGLHLHDKRILDHNSWPGSNKLGRYLEEVRSSLA